MKLIKVLPLLLLSGSLFAQCSSQNVQAPGWFFSKSLVQEPGTLKLNILENTNQKFGKAKLVAAKFDFFPDLSPPSPPSSAPSGPPYYCGARRATGHELDVVQMNLPFGQTASTYCPGFTQSNASGCLPNLGNAIGAGKSILDGFGNKITRCTDSVTDPNKPNTQSWLNTIGNSEQNNIVSPDDKFVALGRSGSFNFILPFDPVAQTCSNPLWPGTSGAFGFNWGAASRVTAGLYYDYSQGTPFPTGVSHTGVIFTVNAATDPNAHTLNGIPTATVVDDLTSSTDKCFGYANGSGNTRYSDSGVPFYPINISNGDLSLNDQALAFSTFAVRNMCWDPAHGIIDWQASTAYSSSAHTCGSITNCGSSVAGTTGAVLTPMFGNDAGCTYQVTTGGTSAVSAPTWLSSCSTVGATVTDSNGVVYTNLGATENWGAARSGLNNICGNQGTSTVQVIYHLTSGNGENAGDCDVLDTMIGHSYHNGVDNGVYSMPDFDGPSYLYGIHAMHGDLTPLYVTSSVQAGDCIGTVSSAGILNWGATCSSLFMNNSINWAINTASGPNGDILYGNNGLGHSAWGVNKMVGSTTAPMFQIQDFQNNSLGYVLPFNVVNPGCGATPGVTCYANGTYTPTTNYPNAQGASQHVTWNANASGLMPTDGAFLIGFTGAGSGYNGYDKPFVDPQLNELDLYMTDGSYNWPIRECQTESTESGVFSSRYHTFNVSADGKFVFFTSDGMNTFGAGSGAGGCGADWAPSTTYSLNQIITPLLNNGPGNNNNSNCSWQATSCSGACTSGSSTPNWQSTAGVSCTAGTTLVDGNVTWTVTGQNTCRYDVLVCPLR